LAKTAPSAAEVSQIELLSSRARQLYDSATFPTLDVRGNMNSQEPGWDHARLVGLHSLYHLVQMVLLCPLVSVFSGWQRQSGDMSDADAGRHKAGTVIEHAGAHRRLIQDFLRESRDVTRITPLMGFACFVAASILLTAVKSKLRRGEPVGRRHSDLDASILQVSIVLRDTLDILETLQTFWEPLKAMVRGLNTTDEVGKLTSKCATTDKCAAL
jgi:hypothetical protein